MAQRAETAVAEYSFQMYTSDNQSEKKKKKKSPSEAQRRQVLFAHDYESLAETSMGHYTYGLLSGSFEPVFFCLFFLINKPHLLNGISDRFVPKQSCTIVCTGCTLVEMCPGPRERETVCTVRTHTSSRQAAQVNHEFLLVTTILMIIITNIYIF